MKAFTKDVYLNWYEDMLFWRKFEDKLAAVYIQQKVRGFLHLYNGQEAVLAGSLHAMEIGKDRMITAYRNHVQPIGLGVDPKKVMAELFGKVTGTSKGMGGSMHIFSKEHGFYGGHGIVGGQIPLGAGLAFADKYFKRDAVTLCYMGDGAVRQGSLHETFNLAMLWQLPVVFICENNGYAMGTSVERTTNVTDIYKMASSYEMNAEQVDGMSCEAVHECMKRTADRARKGEGPTFVELKTYRYRGHSMSDPAKYRTKDEVEAYKKVDPIEVVKEQIIKSNYLTEKQLEEIEESVDAEVLASVEFADNSPFPGPEEIYTDVYETAYPFIVD